MERTTLLFWLSLVAGLSSGCGDKQRDRAIQDPSLPVGSIAGRVTDLRTGAAVPGVAVSVVTVGAANTEEEGLPAIVTATTDTDGHYALADLAAGTSYRTHFVLDGYVPRVADVLIPNAAGQYPQGNAVAELNMPMASSDATIAGRIFAREGGPAAAAVVGIDLRPDGFDLVAEAVADAQGAYSLAGLPGSPAGLSVTVVVQPFDEDADGAADYDAANVATSTFPATSTHLDIDLRAVANQLTLLYSNVDDGLLDRSETIALVWNRPLDLGATTVALRDQTVGADVAVTSSLDAPGTTLSVAPDGSTALATGHAYQLTVDASGTNGTQANVVRAFDVVDGSAGTLPAVSGLTVEPTDVDWDHTFFTLTWNAVAGAASYDIYARDTFANPTYVLVDTAGAEPAPGTSFNLPGEFDYFTGDGMQTPFTFGVGVGFAVVPVSASGVAGDPAAASEMRVYDNVDPVAWDTDQFGGTADNTGGASDDQHDLNVDFTEYMDAASAASTTLTGLPAACTVSAFTFDPGLLSGRFTITVPAGTDCAMCYTIAGARDTSGNTMEDANYCLF
jgi:carboxypeptidase family protein